MTGRYKAYPEYKESGVEWLPELPANWNIERTKRMFSLKRSLVGNQSSNYQLLSLTLKGVIPRDISSGEGKIPESFDTYQKVDKNDLIFCLFDIDETPRTIGISPLNGMITGAYNVYGCLDNCFSDYAYYYFFHIDSFKGLKPFYTGLRKVVRAETFSNIEMPCPSFEEQQKIANFLDHETAKIDTLITKQERLIKLLKEKRQAVISHAVTKGLDPEAPMKNSGVEWLGDVPEHWVVIPNKRLFELTPKKSQIESKKNKLCNFVPMEKLKQDSLVLDEERIISAVFDGYTYFENEDILMAKVTPCFENKNMIVARNLKNGIGFGSSEIYVLRCNKNVSNDFMYYRLQESNFMNIATSAMTGAGGLKRVPADVITNFLVAIPTLDEQLNIVKILKEKLMTFDVLSQKANDAIEVMKERKTALISAAVTGKIDVRDWSLS